MGLAAGMILVLITCCRKMQLACIFQRLEVLVILTFLFVFVNYKVLSCNSLKIMNLCEVRSIGTVDC
jgi:hypothetical protein